MFCEKGNAFSMFVTPEGYIQCVLVRNHECKCLQKTPQGTTSQTSIFLTLNHLITAAALALIIP